MCSMLISRAKFSKNLLHVKNGFIMKVLHNLRSNSDLCHRLYQTSYANEILFSNLQFCSQFSNLKAHHDFSHNLRYAHTNHVTVMFPSFQKHSDYSKKLSSIDKNKTEDIYNLVREWLSRFNLLDTVEFNAVSGTFNTLSKLDIFERRKRKDDQELLKMLIVRLTYEANKILHPKYIEANAFSPWHVAFILNALSKWNVLESNVWPGSVCVDGVEISEVQLFKIFISRLIHHGNMLFDSKILRVKNFDSQAITNCLNALSRWNIDEFPRGEKFVIQLIKQGSLIINKFDNLAVSVTMNALSRWNINKIPGAREFVIQLMKQGDSIVTGKNQDYECTSRSIVGTLNAMSKWDIDELRGSKEFVIHLMIQGISVTNNFSAREVANCLNALSKWNIDDVPEAKGFIISLVNHGCAMIDTFSCQAIANSLNALSKWNINELQGAREFIIRLIKRGCSTAGGFNAQEIANSLNALSKWDINELNGAREFILQMVRCGNLTVDTFNYQGVSNSLNALSKWNVDEFKGAREFIERLISRGNLTTNVFLSQNVANCLNALSKWNIDEIKEARKFIAQLVKRGNKIIDDFNPQNVANTLHALSKWNNENLPEIESFIVQLIKQGSKKIDGFDSQNIANSLNALSKWDINRFGDATEFIFKLITRGISTANGFNSQGIANCLSAISQLNIDKLQGSREFVFRLVKQGNLIADKFTSQEIAGSLNALHRFSIFDSKVWDDDRLSTMKNFIIKLTNKGEKICKEFNSQSAALSLNAFSTLHIFDDDKWSKSEQELMKNFAVELSSVDTAFKDYTLESIYRTYGVLTAWNVFHNDNFNSIERSKFEVLIRNLENQLSTIVVKDYTHMPDADIRLAARFIDMLPELKSKNLIESENYILVSLIRLLSTAVNNCTASRLEDGFLQNLIVTSLQNICTIITDLQDRTSLKGTFNESLFILYNRLVELDFNRIYEVSEIMNQFDKLGIIKDGKVMSM